MKAKWSVAIAAVLAAVAGCGGAEQPQLEEPASTLPPPEAVESATCYDPRLGPNARAEECGQVRRAQPVRKDVWLLQIRRQALVYCVEMHTGLSGFSVKEVQCPAPAYSDEPKPDLRPVLHNPARSLTPRSVSLTAIGAEQTRLVVEATDPGPDAAFPAFGKVFIAPGRCRIETRYPFPGISFPLEDFYSFRSVTILPVALRTLTATPHAFYVEMAAGHPRIEPPYTSCADIGS